MSQSSAMFLLVVLFLVGLASPSSASAATCADYSNQAQAQRAKDTRDADGDGIYCESLPCPCLKPGQSSSGSSLTPASTPKPAAFRPGPSISFGPRTRSSHCHVDGPLPDARCTPGARFKSADRTHICRNGYSASVRNVAQALKDRVFAEYGITSHNGTTYEVDHLVPLELGGSNSIANLFPEAARPTPGFHQKDRLENKAHTRVCAAARPLRATQRSIARDWTVLYIAYFG